MLASVLAIYKKKGLVPAMALVGRTIAPADEQQCRSSNVIDNNEQLFRVFEEQIYDTKCMSKRDPLLCSKTAGDISAQIIVRCSNMAQKPCNPQGCGSG